MAITFKSLLLFSVLSVLFSCSENQKNPSAAAAAPAAEPTTISGRVTAISFGKDGYAADVQTDAQGVCVALVSIPNLGGRENYKACEVGDKVVFRGVAAHVGDAKQFKITEIVQIEPAQTQMLIGQNSFRGIQIGDAISKHGDYVMKTKLKTGEGTFEVFEIKDFENNPAGYFLPDPKNKLLVGDITVTTPKAATEKGLKIGSTFGDLEKIYPAVEVHGSEIEGRTHATAEHLSYRLDAANFSYEVARAKIPATSKIIEITINRAKK